MSQAAKYLSNKVESDEIMETRITNQFFIHPMNIFQKKIITLNYMVMTSDFATKG